MTTTTHYIHTLKSVRQSLGEQWGLSIPCDPSAQVYFKRDTNYTNKILFRVWYVVPDPHLPTKYFPVNDIHVTLSELLTMQHTLVLRSMNNTQQMTQHLSRLLQLYPPGHPARTLKRILDNWGDHPHQIYQQWQRIQ